MNIIKFFLLVYLIMFQSIVNANDKFDRWLISFKKKAESKGISIDKPSLLNSVLSRLYI